MPAVSSPNITVAGWRLEHTYAQLPPLFHASVAPTPVAAPRLVLLNRPLAEKLGLNADDLNGELGSLLLSGNQLPPGALPLAQAYAGHQFGYFTALGDGRALLLGEQITPNGKRWDIQLKGSGPTPFSRRGDGRAALGPMLREYVISEAMHALGIPTTRSLAVVATGETVYRQEALPGAILTRVAASHLRVGTFQWAAARGDVTAVQALVQYTVTRHFPELQGSENPARELLARVVRDQAKLIARWMLVGFVHGVMNTDNMSIAGETIDYGPCAFMDAYDPGTVFSSIDRDGRYAYGNQPSIAQWNLARFAEALLPLLHPVESDALNLANEIIASFRPTYEQHWLDGMRRKLGLFTAEEGDRALMDGLLGWMHRAHADFTATFANLGEEGSRPTADAERAAWQEAWKDRLTRQPQTAEASLQLRRNANPRYIPRNHKVEEALSAAQLGDLRPFGRLLEVISAPYDRQRCAPEYEEPAPASGARYRTFCGT